jgi:hypothetical protein
MNMLQVAQSGGRTNCVEDSNYLLTGKRTQYFRTKVWVLVLLNYELYTTNDE